MGTVKRILTPAEATSIQVALNKHGAQLEVDGHFGELSHLALIRFQHEAGIVPEDGYPSRTTTDALGIPPITTPAPAPPPKLTPNPIVQAIALNLVPLILSIITKGAIPMNITNDQINGIIRLVLGLIGGYFVSKGIVTQSAIDWITAGALTLVPAIWSWYSNRPKTILSIADKQALNK